MQKCVRVTKYNDVTRHTDSQVGGSTPSGQANNDVKPRRLAMTSQDIQTVILIILVGLVALSVTLWLLRQLWAVINTPVAIAIVLAVLAIFLHFTTVEF